MRDTEVQCQLLTLDVDVLGTNTLTAVAPKCIKGLLYTVLLLRKSATHSAGYTT